jgi:uncharacterized phage-associated protein
MTTINLVADYFIKRASESGSLLTNLKIQKLCYYAQAWYLALQDEPLFPERFEAWVHGPVNRALYDRFRSYRWSPITEEVGEPQFSEKVGQHLDLIVENFMACDAYELERMTHEELPWIEARNGLPEDAACATLIKEETMAKFYKEMLQSAA